MIAFMSICMVHISEVFTDNNPLMYMLTTAKLDATGQRWVANLATYNFTIHYRNGKQNIEADALCRIEQVLINSVLLQAYLEGISVNDTMIPLSSESEEIHVNTLQIGSAPKMSTDEWAVKQCEDHEIGIIYRLFKGNQHLQCKLKDVENLNSKIILRYKQDLIMKNNLLYQKFQLKNKDSITFQFIVPCNYHKQALTAIHDEFGHLGIDRLTVLLQERFFWPRMNDDICSHIRVSEHCTAYKQTPEQEELQPILTSYPLEMIHMDFLSIGQADQSKSLNVLVITDHFTRYAQAVVTQKQTAPIVAKALWKNWLMYYRWPVKILTDRGKSFENKLIHELCKITEVQKLRTYTISTTNKWLLQKI